MSLDILENTYNENYILFNNYTPYNYIYEENNQFYSLKEKIKEYDSLYSFYKNFKSHISIKINEREVILIYINSIDDYTNLKENILLFYNKLNKNNENNLIDLSDFDDVNIDQTIKNKKLKWKNLVEESKEQFKELSEIHDNIDALPQLNTYEEINDTIINNIERKIYFEDKYVYLDKKNVLYIFDSLECSTYFPYVKYKSYIKIYDDIEIFDKNFNNIYDDDNEDDIIYFYFNINKKKYLNYINITKQYISIFYSSDSLIYEENFKKFYKNCILGYTISNYNIGTFQLNFPEFNINKFYYLIHLDKIFSYFFYLKEFSNIRSLKNLVKIYYKKPGFINKYYESDYTGYFEANIEKSNLLIKYKLKTKNINDITILGQILSKLYFIYDNFKFSKHIENLMLLDENITDKKYIQKKIHNLREKDPLLFQKYSKLCLCPFQPVIIDEEDIEDWENFNKLDSKPKIFLATDIYNKIYLIVNDSSTIVILVEINKIKFQKSKTNIDKTEGHTYVIEKKYLKIKKIENKEIYFLENEKSLSKLKYIQCSQNTKNFLDDNHKFVFTKLLKIF